ncbi:hypothetical protein EVA_21553 [gut metagenome]|uniref:Uncharacterized protein n=1 Tax=gut metagenome TaxID=749906 RepID=J9BRY7_9ZZZZ
MRLSIFAICSSWESLVRSSTAMMLSSTLILRKTLASCGR